MLPTVSAVMAAKPKRLKSASQGASSAHPKRGGQKRRVPTAASEVNAAFAARLTALRQTYGRSVGNHNLSRAAFARMLGLEAETYRRYERAETTPSIATFAKIRQLTGVNLNTLIADEVDRS